MPQWCFEDIEPIIYVFWALLLLFTTCTAIFNLWAVWQLLALKTNKSKTCLSIICILISALFMASGLFYVVHTSQSIFCSEPVSWTYSGCIAIDCYMLALSLLYIFYVFRLQFMFQNTPYALSITLLLVLLMGFVVQIVCIFVSTLFLLENNINIGLKAYFAFNAFNFLFNMWLIVLFVAKIYVLGHTTTKNVEKQQDKLNKSVQSLLSPTIRYIICAFVSLLSSNLLSTFGIIRAEVRPSQALRMSHILLIVMDQCVNSYFLYLQYPFGDKQYEKRCHQCHNCILGSFAHAVHSAVEISKEPHNTTETKLKFAPGGTITSSPSHTDEEQLQNGAGIDDGDPSTQRTTTSELNRQRESDRKFISNVKSIEWKSRT